MTNENPPTGPTDIDNILATLPNEADLDWLFAQGIGEQDARDAKLERFTNPRAAELLNTHVKAGVNLAGLAFPYYWPGEELARLYRLRLDYPLSNQTHKQTHDVPMLYFAPRVRAHHLNDVYCTAVITDSETNALALSWQYNHRNQTRAVMALPEIMRWSEAATDLERIVWRGRPVEIITDTLSEETRLAVTDLAAELKRRGARVLVVEVPYEIEGQPVLPPISIGYLLAHDQFHLLEDLCEQARRKAKEREIETMGGNIRFKVNDQGVYATNPKTGDIEWVCSPLYVEADTRDHAGQNWGRLLRWPDSDGRQHSWAMPMELLFGAGKDHQQYLVRNGLVISPMSIARTRLDFYLSQQPKEKALAVDRIGWHQDMFVLPDETIGQHDDGDAVYLQTVDTNPLIKTAGTLQEWQESIGAFCAGNSRLVFSVSLAFAAPLLGIVGQEGGGFHIKGQSSEGKSTALYVAGSVWGGSKSGFIRRWRATGSALESVAVSHNDGFLALDEIAECTASEIGNIAYMLANAQGRIRSMQGFNNRPTREWLLLFLSTGELSLQELMASIGQHTKEGQEVRFVTIESNAGCSDSAGRPLGLFEDLHAFDHGAQFSKHLVRCAKTYYGTPIRAFLQKLVTERAALESQIRAAMTDFARQHVPANAHPQVGRVAERFALAAFAGELATRYEVTGWKPGEATAASVKLFNEWLTRRGTAGSVEEDSSIKQVRTFIERCADSRFQTLDGPAVSDRVGFKKLNGGLIEEFWVLPSAFRDELCAGFDVQRVARLLKARGWLLAPENATAKGLTLQRTLPELGRKGVYVILPSLLE